MNLKNMHFAVWRNRYVIENVIRLDSFYHICFLDTTVYWEKISVLFCTNIMFMELLRSELKSKQLGYIFQKLHMMNDNEYTACSKPITKVIKKASFFRVKYQSDNKKHFNAGGMQYPYQVWVGISPALTTHYYQSNDILDRYNRYTTKRQWRYPCRVMWLI